MKIVQIIITLTFIVHDIIAQNCNADNIIGQWIFVASGFGDNHNIDSLKAFGDTAHKRQGVYTFRNNNTFSYKSDLEKSSSKSRGYFFDTKTCEIILFTDARKKQRDRHNLEILYIDDKYLIFKDNNNPKDIYYTCLLKKY